MRAWLPRCWSLLGAVVRPCRALARATRPLPTRAEADAAPLVQPSPLPEGVLGASRRPPLTDDPHALTAAARGTEGLAASVPVQPPWRPTVDVGEAERARAAVCAGGAPSLPAPPRRRHRPRHLARVGA